MHAYAQLLHIPGSPAGGRVHPRLSAADTQAIDVHQMAILKKLKFPGWQFQKLNKTGKWKVNW